VPKQNNLNDLLAELKKDILNEINVPYTKRDFARELERLLRDADVDFRNGEINQSKLAKYTSIKKQSWSKYLDPLGKWPDIVTFRKIVILLKMKSKEQGKFACADDLLLLGETRTVASDREIQENLEKQFKGIKKQVIALANVFKDNGGLSKEQILSNREKFPQVAKLFNFYPTMFLANISFMGKSKITKNELLKVNENTRKAFLGAVNPDTIYCNRELIEKTMLETLYKFDKDDDCYGLIRALCVALEQKN